MKYVFPILALLACAGTHIFGEDFDPKKYKEYNKIGIIAHVKEPTLCMLPAWMDPDSPHMTSAHLIYYANNLAAENYTKVVKKTDGPYNRGPLPENLPKFPIGSIIVKEKWLASDKSKPHVITVMKKINDKADASSWKYDMYDTENYNNVTEAFLAKNKKSCIDCHAKWSETDYISRDGVALFLQYEKPKGNP